MKLRITTQNNNDALMAWENDNRLTHGVFLDDVRAVVRALPNRKHVINLCNDRYLFMVSFVAAIIKEQINLLPQDRVYETLYAINEDYKDCYCISDRYLSELILEQVNINDLLKRENTNRENSSRNLPKINAEQIAAIVFTSGSTGKPKANNKTWGSLVQGAQRTANRFGLYDSNLHIVSTVPPQHMFGLESSVMLCLQCNLPMNRGRPFYPEDIRKEIETVENNIILVTTPFHLRACTSTQGVQWKNLDFILSATAPLNIDIAKQAEEKMQTKVKEIYGCTELGAIASRDPIDSLQWHLYDGLELYQEKDKSFVNIKGSQEPIVLNDNVKILDGDSFELLGRNEDIINIAGKRGSLADIKLKLLSIKGIDDAAIYLPDSEKDIVRLTAFIVAKSLTTKEVSTAMLNKVDSIFIPRPIYIVSSLPYNESGKLSQQSLKTLAVKCKRH